MESLELATKVMTRMAMMMMMPGKNCRAPAEIGDTNVCLCLAMRSSEMEIPGQKGPLFPDCWIALFHFQVVDNHWCLTLVWHLPFE